MVSMVIGSNGEVVRKPPVLFVTTINYNFMIINYSCRLQLMIYDMYYINIIKHFDEYYLEVQFQYVLLYSDSINY